MNNDQIKQRAFILSSLSRSKILISTYAYKFADKIINEGWMPSLGNLPEVDSEIKIKYEEFINSYR
jgi:hypothetical protein